uniref:Uncharacterized protein n=1 Tax=Pipistrellus kuhlii TaxID=59472 RepID=A0A7J7WD58_PIPKU|nr:hypothetical protein mPipKuh1_008050 [Pipistrellus kuhlii]
MLLQQAGPGPPRPQLRWELMWLRRDRTPLHQGPPNRREPLSASSVRHRLSTTPQAVCRVCANQNASLREDHMAWKPGPPRGPPSRGPGLAPVLSHHALHSQEGERAFAREAVGSALGLSAQKTQLWTRLGRNASMGKDWHTHSPAGKGLEGKLPTTLLCHISLFPFIPTLQGCTSPDGAWVSPPILLSPCVIFMCQASSDGKWPGFLVHDQSQIFFFLLKVSEDPDTFLLKTKQKQKQKHLLSRCLSFSISTWQSQPSSVL